MPKKKVKIQSEAALRAFLNIIAEESVYKARKDLRYGTYADEEEILQHAARDERRNQGRLEQDLDALSSSWGPEQKPQQATEADDEDIFKKALKDAGKSDDSQESKEKSDNESSSDDSFDLGDSETDAEPDEDDVNGEKKISFVMIRDQLNTIRSGRSLRDKDIREELKDYVNSLDRSEKVALHAFLEGIAQIITAGIDSDSATDPSEPPHEIEMSSSPSDDEESISSKGKIAKRPVKRKRSKKSKEDTTAPIQVGKKQTTESIRRRIRELMG